MIRIPNQRILINGNWNAFKVMYFIIALDSFTPSASAFPVLFTSSTRLCDITVSLLAIGAPVFRIGSPGIIFVDYLDKLGLKAIRF